MPIKFEYSIESVLLTSSVGKESEIKDLIVGLDFYESLSSPYIKCELAVVDAANLIESVPLLGQEKIKLHIKDLNTGNTIKRNFYIASVNNYVKGNSQTAMYVLKLVTAEYMMNSLLLVSQAFTGTISDSIAKLAKDYLKSTVKTNEKSSGDYKVIIPNWNPYKAIEWLTLRGISSKGYPFVFYDTLKDGLVFESYETIYAKTVFNKYVHRSGNTSKDDADQKAAMMNTALQYDIVEMSNTGKNVLRGAFGQGMHVIDHSNRSYNFITYDYAKDFKKKDRLDKFPYVSDQFTVNNKKLTEYDAIHSTLYKNSLAFESTNTNNYNNKGEFTKLESDPFMYQTSLVKITMTIKGRSDLTVGKVIDFEVERNRPVSVNTSKNSNEYLSGKYVVQNIHHKMEAGKYYIVMDVAKESLGKKVKK